MRQYRIGEYAKYLGVTPDLLKHYEEVGVIRSDRSESGYRYYSFQTTMELIECVRLRNYGLTLREIREALTEHHVQNADMDRLFEGNMEKFRQEMLLDEALREDYASFCDWRRGLEDRDWDWEIRRSRPMFFLPHTDRYDFLKDPRIYELLNEWMSYIPIVKSSLRIEKNGAVTWGFAVEESMQRRLNMPLNDVVEQIPSQKIFCFKFRAPLLPLGQEIEQESHPAFEKLKMLQLQYKEQYYRTTLMPADWQQGLGYQYGYYAIPLTGE